VSLTPQQCAQVLYLYHVEGVSIIIIALMTELSCSTVKRVLHETSRQDVPAAWKEAAMRPQSKGCIEHQIHYIRAQVPRPSTAASPPRRRSRRERRHDRT
jgi:hypothetical protein